MWLRQVEILLRGGIINWMRERLSDSAKNVYKSLYGPPIYFFIFSFWKIIRASVRLCEIERDLSRRLTLRLE